jgi:signal transduction histidine kinase
MIAIKILNSNSLPVFNTFPEDFDYELLKIKDNRYFVKEYDYGSLEVFVSSDKNNNDQRLVHSNKNFNSLIRFIEGISPLLIKNIKDNTEEILDEYLHNIIKIHGNQKVIVERFTYFEKPTESYSDFVEAVENKIREKPEEFSRDICELSKEIRFMDYHIGGYRLLNNKNLEKDITRQNLKRFLLGLSHQFFKDLSINDINLDLRDINENIFCYFEYETFNIAIHNFFQNAVKYTKPQSLIKVSTDNKSQLKLIFSMYSVKIEENEKKTIFDRGTYGVNTPKELRGNGIGMNTIKKALERSNIKLEIEVNQNTSVVSNGIPYTQNVFYFIFPKV